MFVACNLSVYLLGLALANSCFRSASFSFYGTTLLDGISDLS